MTSSKIKKLSLGTAQLGMRYGIANLNGQPTFEVAQAIIDLARNSGIKNIDTAKSYGSSEKNLGQIGVTEFNITTKLVNIPENSINLEHFIRNQIQQSLNLLRIELLDGILIHDSKLLYGERGIEVVKVLSKLRSEGLTHKIGVSIYEPDELKNIKDLTQLDIVQAPFNVLDRRIEETGWLTWLSEKNIEIEARSIFLQGLLLLERSNVPIKFEKWSNILDEWDLLVKNSNSTRLELCLDFVLNHPLISKVIVGVETSKQLEDIIGLALSPNLLGNSVSFLTQVDDDLINPFNWTEI